MRRTFSFNKTYAIAAALLFGIEVCIALFVKDRFVRPYVGDLLVVILIYCFLRSFWQASPIRVGLYVLLFAFAIEIGQHFNLVDRIGLGHSKLARIVIGTGFAWGDLLAYTLGIVAVWMVERKKFSPATTERPNESTNAK